MYDDSHNIIGVGSSERHISDPRAHLLGSAGDELSTSGDYQSVRINMSTGLDQYGGAPDPPQRQSQPAPPPPPPPPVEPEPEPQPPPPPPPATPSEASIETMFGVSNKPTHTGNLWTSGPAQQMLKLRMQPNANLSSLGLRATELGAASADPSDPNMPRPQRSAMLDNAGGAPPPMTKFSEVAGVLNKKKTLVQRLSERAMARSVDPISAKFAMSPNDDMHTLLWKMREHHLATSAAMGTDVPHLLPLEQQQQQQQAQMSVS